MKHRVPTVVISVVGWTVCALLAASGTPPSAAATDWIAATLGALSHHLEYHPQATAEDVYKLLHQAVMGPGHAIPDRAAARGWLLDEVRHLDADRPAEELCEPLGGEPQMVRIHLRPLLASDGDLDLLLTEFVASAADATSDPSRLDKLLRAATDLLAATDHGELARDLARLRIELSAAGFPALRHSDRFRQAYRPAYRVVTRDRARAAGWCD